MKIDTLHVVLDCIFELARRAVSATANLALGQSGEPALNVIQPRRRGRGEVNMEARMPGKLKFPRFRRHGRRRKRHGDEARLSDGGRDCRRLRHRRATRSKTTPGMHEVDIEAMRQRDRGNRRPGCCALGQKTRLQIIAVATARGGLCKFYGVHLLVKWTHAPGRAARLLLVRRAAPDAVDIWATTPCVC